MRAGLLDDIIILYHMVTSINDYGEQVQTWVRGRTVRANAQYKGGGLTSNGYKQRNYYQKQFLVYHHEVIDESFRIRYNNKFYRILSIDDEPKLNQKIINTELVNE